jgi:hypothetical protein
VLALGKSQAVDSSSHMDVREEQLNVAIRLEGTSNNNHFFLGWITGAARR